MVVRDVVTELKDVTPRLPRSLDVVWVADVLLPTRVPIDREREGWVDLGEWYDGQG